MRSLGDLKNLSGILREASTDERCVTTTAFLRPSGPKSHCGHQVEEMLLSVREWTCLLFRSHHDRDTNVASNIPPFAVTPGRGEGAYPKPRGEIDTLREGTLAPSPKDFREARTETSGPPFTEGHVAWDRGDPGGVMTRSESKSARLASMRVDQNPTDSEYRTPSPILNNNLHPLWKNCAYSFHTDAGQPATLVRGGNLWSLSR